MSESSLYLQVAEDLRRNIGQWEAYESTGHCVVLAGPGSGKTKTLTVKLARMLAEDVEEPRGIACITFSNETARELESRLDSLGVARQSRVFIGTVHSFALTQVILPYAKVARMGLPEDFKVATQQEQRAALEIAYQRVIGGPGNPHDSRLEMDRYRRSILDRGSPAWRQNPERAELVEAYEAELRRRNRIDFDDMPLLTVRAFREHEWLQRAIKAKFPILLVDEYQDLGRPLHRMVMGLCFSTGVRLFAVGDVDQSLYGFTGAHPELLRQLSARDDVQTVRLRMNYRSGSRIVTASQYALGEQRDYEVPDDAAEGTIYFHPATVTYENQAEGLFTTILPEVFQRIPTLTEGGVAILYPAAWIGNAVANAARNNGYDVVRADTNALYPRYSSLMRWLELCAVWCCGGWRTGQPRFRTLAFTGARMFGEQLSSSEQRQAFARRLIGVLWNRRAPDMLLRQWLAEFRTQLLDEFFNASRSQDDERAILTAFQRRVAVNGDAAGMTLEQFAGQGEGNDRITLSTLHSSKGREFDVVVLFGIDDGRLPRRGASAAARAEARRTFYVGFTRAKQELHMMFSRNNASPFVREVQERLEE